MKSSNTVESRGRIVGLRSALEALMYLAFSVAALPFAWVGVNDALYHHAHPEMLESRDAAPEVLAIVAAMEVPELALGLAVLLALYFLVTGPRGIRLRSSALVVAWLLMVLSSSIVTAPPIDSTGRLYWDAVPFVLLSILPWICAGIRLSGRAPRPTAGGRRALP